MRSLSSVVVCAAAAVVLSDVGSVALGQSFRLLGTPPAGVRADAVSADGSVVVGESTNGCYFWTASSGFEYFAVPPQSPDAVRAYGVSGDGNFAVGEAEDFLGAPTTYAYRQQRGGTMQVIGRQAGYSHGIAMGASQDGGVVVGRSESGVGGAVGQAFRWTGSTGLVGLGYTRPDHFYSEAAAVSRDGSTVVGHGHGSSGYTEAFVWTETLGMQPLPGLDANNTGRAFGVNHDGSIVVGDSRTPATARIATMWHNGVPTVLDLPAGFFFSSAVGVSDSGTVVVGSLSGNTGQVAAIWTSDRGMEPLTQYLAFYGITVPDSVSLYKATGISADGQTIVGITDTGMQGWVATIPCPGSLGATGLCVTCAFRRTRCNSVAG